MLCQTNQDLAKIARVIGQESDQFEVWAKQTKKAVTQKLWDEKNPIYFDYHLRSGQIVEVPVAAEFLLLFAGISSPDQAERMMAHFNQSGF